MLLSEAKLLYPECEEFERTRILSDDSLVRKRAKKLYGRDYGLQLLAVCTEVWHVLARDRMKGEEK